MLLVFLDPDFQLLPTFPFIVLSIPFLSFHVSFMSFPVL